MSEPTVQHAGEEADEGEISALVDANLIDWPMQRHAPSPSDAAPEGGGTDDRR